MITKSIYKKICVISVICGFTVSCTGDLDTVPIDKDDLVSSVVFGSEIGAYEESLAKIYAGLVIGGNKGGDDEQDVVGIDGIRYSTLLLE